MSTNPMKNRHGKKECNQRRASLALDLSAFRGKDSMATLEKLGVRWRTTTGIPEACLRHSPTTAPASCQDNSMIVQTNTSMCQHPVSNSYLVGVVGSVSWNLERQGILGSIQQPRMTRIAHWPHTGSTTTGFTRIRPFNRSATRTLN